MKRFLNRLFCMLAVAGMGMFVTGCSVEDGDKEQEGIDNESGEVEKGICLWELSGEEIVLRESDAEGAATQILGPITELTEDNMTIVIEGFPITWRRVADSEIEEYLE